MNVKEYKFKTNLFAKQHPCPRRLFDHHQFSRHSSELIQEDYAAHGVLNAITPVSYNDEDKLFVGVISVDWPAWAVPFSHPRFILRWIIIANVNLFQLVQKCFPDILVLVADTLPPGILEAVDIVCYNGKACNVSLPPVFGSICLFDWNVRLKRWKDWHIHAHQVEHSACGGVSDFGGMFKIAIFKEMLQSFQLNDDLIGAYPSASLDAILSHTENGTNLTVAPRLATLPKPKVTKTLHDCFHPGGLFPVNEIKPSFLVPSVFSPSRWVKRQLTSKERLEVQDVPISLVSCMTAVERRRLSQMPLVPIKCLTAFVQGVFLRGTITISGGGQDLNARLLSTNMDSSIQATPSSSASQPRESINGLPGAWVHNSIHNNDEKAVKHDDAKVPIHFWNTSLAEKLNMSALSTKQCDALDILREALVRRVWVRNLTKCFCKYLRCQECHLERLLAKFNHKCERRKFDCNFCKFQRNSHQTIQYKKGRFKWAKNGGRKEYIRWYSRYRGRNSKKGKEEIDKDIEVGTDCLRRAIACTAWTWEKGSRLFFWRWGEFRDDARDGAKTYVQGPLPRCTKKQRAPKDKRTLELVQEKLLNVRSKGYIGKGPVVSVTSLFDVPKGKDDIRLVYNATDSGLNEAVWAPWFSLQTCESHLRAVDPGTYMGDADLGEMFLNFPLDVNMRQYAGVDFSKLFPDECIEGETFWERWERMLMGFRPSPYCTTRDMRRIDLFLRGAADNKANVFRWAKVVLNLPGKVNYTSTRPRVYRVREDGTMAADLFTYIDDLRNTAPTSPECWDGLHQVCSRLTWLGLQDAARKRNGPTQTPRAWAGSIVHTDGQAVTVLVSEEKWEKTKDWIVWVLAQVEKPEGLLYKELLSCRGFLIYVSRTYRPFKPYLRGLHKTIDSWRPHRDNEGWRLMQSVIDAQLNSSAPSLQDDYSPPSKFIKPLPRLKTDFLRLQSLTSTEAPPKVVRRRQRMGSANYGFGDASGKGFGHAIEVEGEVHSEFGQWASELEDKHSNYKELRNLVNAVEKAYRKGLLKDCELFLFTDNFVAECGYYNSGSNRSKDLDELVHRLWRIQMAGDFTLHVYHVAGTRMIECGVDGLSRGDKSEGIAKGVGVLTFVPIHLNAVERSPRVLDWILEWWDESLGELKIMSPEDWFLNVMDIGNFLWMVAPGAGEVAVEQLCSHIHGRPETNHIFVIPRLCTCSWRKQLLKACNVVITIQPKFIFWNTNMHEPLLIGICFPLLPAQPRFKPWRLKHTKLVDRFKSEVHRMQASGNAMDWSILRKFLLQARSIPSVSDGLARELLQVTYRG